MHSRLWLRFFLILVCVTGIALSAALLLRSLMLRDFSTFLEGQREDQASLITAALESSFEAQGTWDKERLVRDISWACLLGAEVRLYDADGRPVLDTKGALEALSPLARKRIGPAWEEQLLRANTVFIPYDLFLEGRTIGRVDMRTVNPGRERHYIARSGTLLLVSVVVLGLVSVLASLLFARSLGRPIHQLTTAVSALADGDLGRRVQLDREDELGVLSRTFNSMARKLQIQEGLRKRISANVAHELRTPVAAIQGELEGMVDGLIPLEKATLRSIQEEIERLRKILKGMEDLAQAESSGLSLRVSQFPLLPFLRNITDRFRSSLLGSAVSLEIVCPEDLAIAADPERLSQILINLISNALKAVGARGSIVLRASQSDQTISIEVEDNGAGIDERDLPFVFERFYRASEGGLGIGLSIAQELATAHGGGISVRSRPGQGSVFTLTLPREIHISS